MRVHFFGPDRNRLQLCETSAELFGVEARSFDSFGDALQAWSPGEGVAIASGDVLVSGEFELPSEATVLNPGDPRAPSNELTLLGKEYTMPNGFASVADVNRQAGVIHHYYRPDLLASFDPNVPADYDFSRYRQIPRFISFSKVPNERAKRASAMSEMIQLLKHEPFDFRDFVEKEIVRRLALALRSGERLEPAGAPTFGVERFVSVCDSGFDDDLWRLIPTVAGFHPDCEFHLFCDRKAAKTAREVIRGMIPSGENVHIRQVITRDSLRKIEKSFGGVNQSNYWRPGPIWWKLEALRSVLEEEEKPTLLVDCDITFAAPVKDTFCGVDLVMSPFYWPNPSLKVRISPESDKFVPIAERDGWFNAGYLLATRKEIAETWLELFEQSVGGFYEQFCMGYLPQRFRHDVFGTSHNWGQWRCESPPPHVVSLHAHRRTDHTHEFGQAIQVRAEESASRFLK